MRKNLCSSMVRGAKVAMTVALRSPGMLGAVIPVDNAPIDAVLRGDFQKYVEGMQEIQNAQVKTQSEADRILTKYEQVHIMVFSKPRLN